MDIESLKLRIKYLYWDACQEANANLLGKDHPVLKELDARLILKKRPNGSRKGFSVVDTEMSWGELYDEGPEYGGRIFLEFPTKRAERMILMGWMSETFSRILHPWF